MFLTIAICTWNRGAQLRRTLDSLVDLAVDHPLERLDWEVVVVDNASTDSTPQVAGSFIGRLPLRVVHEPQLGLAHARTAATAAAAGDWIAFLDDDVLVAAGWLEALRAGVAAHHEAAFFAGRVEPVFEGRVGGWLGEALEDYPAVFAKFDLGAADIALGEATRPVGANMVLRTDLQREFGYRPQLGRSGTGMVSGEETDVIQRMVAAGHRGWYLPALSVEHLIPPHRQTIGHILRWNYGAGYAGALISHGAEGPSILSIPRWIIGAILRYQGRALLALVRGDPRATLLWEAKTVQAVGGLRGYRRKPQFDRQTA